MAAGHELEAGSVDPASVDSGQVEAAPVERAPRRSARVGRALRVGLGVAGIVLAMTASSELWCGAAYLAGLHDHLGSGVLPALLALWTIAASLTLAPALWAAWPLARSPLVLRALSIGAPLALAVAVGLVAHSHSLARPTATAAGERRLDEVMLVAALSSLADLAPRLPLAPGRPPPLATAAPAKCRRSPELAPVTLIATFVDKRRRLPQMHCFQGSELGT